MRGASVPAVYLAAILPVYGEYRPFESLVRSVSRLVLADDPASALISAAVFCFRRYSAVRVVPLFLPAV